MSDRTPTSVYLYYDIHDVLIYVGITSRGIGRNHEHNASKVWWAHVARQEVEHYPDRVSAHAREVALIKRFTPPFNVQHNRDHVAMRAAYEDMLTQSLSGADPLTAVRSLRKALPLSILGSDDNRYVFRTKVEHALIAARIFPHHTKQTKVILGDQRVGHLDKVESRGPFILIHATIRRGLSPADAVADLNIIMGKQTTFQIRRIRLACASQAAA